jgi:hypothetical protein
MAWLDAKSPGSPVKPTRRPDRSRAGSRLEKTTLFDIVLYLVMKKQPRAKASEGLRISLVNQCSGFNLHIDLIYIYEIFEERLQNISGIFGRR